MGQYLSTPVTEKEVDDGQNDKLAYGLAAMQGWRVGMEDDHVAALNFQDNVSMFAVFDGHGGKAVAKYCARHLIPELVKLEEFKTGDYGEAIKKAYYNLDENLDTEHGIAELKELAGPGSGSGSGKGTPTSGAGLFSHVEGSLDNNNNNVAHLPPIAEQQQEHQHKVASHSESSDKFVDSHLKRVSLDRSGEHTPPPVEGSPLAANTTTTTNDNVDDPPQATTPLTELPLDGENSEDGDEMQGAMGVGCTAVAALVKDNMLLVANTGDSRCVLSKKGVAVPLTLDHKPILLEEAQRIVKAGGFVRDNRVNGALNVSRTLGDLDFKRNDALPHTEQMVVATPDIEVLELTEGDEFLIVACDGIWDVLSNQEAVEFVRKRIKQGVKLRQICEQMCDYCLAPDLKGLCRGADNMSVIIVLFRKTAHLDSVVTRMWAGCMRALGLSNTSRKNP